MDVIKLFVEELEREVARSRKALEQLPEGKREWKPHDKSMQFGYLCDMVATIPTWITMIVKQDSLDIAPKDGGSHRPPPMNSPSEYVAALEKAAKEAKAALEGTTESHLQTRWQLLAGGNVALDLPRHEMIRDTINHWSHHRGQMTVYLRLLGAKVPALYGPSADDRSFG